MDPTLREFMLQISSSQPTRITWASLLRILMYCLRQRSWVIRAKLGKFCSNQEKVINIEGKYMCVCEWSRSVIVRLFATPWTVAHQASPSMGFSRQEYWSGLPFPSPGDLPNPGIEPSSPGLQADALPSEPPGKISKVVLPQFQNYFNTAFYVI